MRKTTSLHHHDLLCTCKGGRHCMLMSSQEFSEYVSEFLSTTDYVLVSPISIARFLRTVCKLGGTIPLAPGSTRVTKKHMPALYPIPPIRSDCRTSSPEETPLSPWAQLTNQEPGLANLVDLRRREGAAHHTRSIHFTCSSMERTTPTNRPE